MKHKAGIYLSIMILPLMICGCMSIGFQNFGRDQMNIYDDMLKEYIKPLNDKSWFWVRGKTTGDLNADGVEEEVILASIHDGPRADSTPIDKLVVLICKRDSNNKPILLRRSVVYEASKGFEGASLPHGVHLDTPKSEIFGASARIIDIDGKAKGLVTVSIYGKQKDGRYVAWHRGYIFPNEGLPEVKFNTLAVQQDPTIINLDLDKDGVDELLVNQAPLEIPQDADTSELDPPSWMSIYARNAEGDFIQSDEKFCEPYEELIEGWYENYVKAWHNGASAESLAIYEYYLGSSHLMLGEKGMAKRFLARAVEHSKGKLNSLAKEALDKASRK
ncbi:MAG: hypothetical protein JXR97_06250 [Planctomycetes bacterium]|nr:hypothetical protein [Planctomycetota bacterium]